MYMYIRNRAFYIATAVPQGKKHTFSYVRIRLLIIIYMIEKVMELTVKSSLQSNITARRSVVVLTLGQNSLFLMKIL